LIADIDRLSSVFLCKEKRLLVMADSNGSQTVEPLPLCFFTFPEMFRDIAASDRTDEVQTQAAHGTVESMQEIANSEVNDNPVRLTPNPLLLCLKDTDSIITAKQ
jgi:hypothetical protein